MGSTSAGSVALGLVLVVFAGMLNGSWNAAFSPGVAVSSTDLDFALAWALFQLYAALLNIPVCLAWAGGLSRASWIVSQASAWDIGAVVLFSLLWGVGSVLFGWACRIAGVGLGTNLTMGVIMILGTLLPLLMEDGLAKTATGSVIFIGLAVCSAGLVCSMLSLKTRDLDEEATKVSETHKDERESDLEEEEISDAAETPTTGTSATTLNPSDQKRYTTAQKVFICIVAGIFATSLQFAFVFGENLIDLAESSDGPGTTPSSGSSAVIWLFAISVSAPVSFIYGLHTSRVPLSTAYTCPWHRHVFIVLTTSVPWVAHIHLYGYSNSTLPAHVAASISWPILMMLTVTTGLVWSIVLGEWNLASRLARRQLGMGMAVISMGVILLMSTVAL